MPDFIAVWLPLIRGTFTKPAEQPISAPPGKDELRHRLPAALIDRARAVGDPLAALEKLADRRMLLPALELLERREPWIAVVERDDEAEGDLAVRLMIEEAAAPGVVERPALGVDHPARLVLVRARCPRVP